MVLYRMAILDDMLPGIAGLRYVPEYLDVQTHNRLLTAVDRHRWLATPDHRVQIYGYSYDHATRAVYRIGELPEWATDLAGRLWRDGLLPNMPDQMVINDYQPGAGIFAHVDQTVLGDTIVSVSLGSTCVMRFSHCESERKEELLLEPRSALVLSGEARWHWKHEIPSCTVDTWQNQKHPRSRRVSLTFRVMPHATNVSSGRPM